MYDTIVAGHSEIYLQNRVQFIKLFQLFCKWRASNQKIA